MPEGPEVKTVARTLKEALVGKTLNTFWHSPYQLRKPADYKSLKRLTDQTIDDVYSYGKVLFISANKKPFIFAQLGMTGQLMVCPKHEPIMPHTHARWSIEKTAQELRYIDPRRFGLIDSCDEKKQQTIINRLGPDPFSITNKDFERICTALEKSKRAIKEVLLDQSVIAGVGNIYASEALFLAKVNPEKSACTLDKKTCSKIIKAVIEVMHIGYQNCGTTFSSYVDGTGKKGNNINFVKVFQKEGNPCFTCQTKIIRIKQGGRSTFLCSHCQK